MHTGHRSLPCRPSTVLVSVSVNYTVRACEARTVAQKHALFFRPLIKKKLSQGVTLVVDRYAFSGVAFTSAKEVSAAGSPVGRCGVRTQECVGH